MVEVPGSRDGDPGSEHGKPPESLPVVQSEEGRSSLHAMELSEVQNKSVSSFTSALGMQLKLQIRTNSSLKRQFPVESYPSLNMYIY